MAKDKLRGKKQPEIKHPEVYYRSEQTNELFEKLCIQHGIGIVLTLPEIGEVRLQGDLAREFLWTVRSHKSTFLIDNWLKKLKQASELFERQPVLEKDNA